MGDRASKRAWEGWSAAVVGAVAVALGVAAVLLIYLAFVIAARVHGSH